MNSHFTKATLELRNSESIANLECGKHNLILLSICGAVIDFSLDIAWFEWVVNHSRLNF